MQLACAVGDVVLPAVGPAVPDGVAVGVAFVDGVTVVDGLVVAVDFAVDGALLSSSSHGGRLEPVPSWRSLMICSASPSVVAGTVFATSCWE